MHLVETKKLYLRKAIKWEDPYEGMVAKNIASKLKEIGAEQFANDYEDALNHTYGTSWTLHEESDALWRIYSPKKTGVQIQTTVSKLKTALKGSLETELKEIKDVKDAEFRIRKVKYCNAQILQALLCTFVIPNDTLNAFLMKNIAYEHEKEVRGLIYLPAVDKNMIPASLENEFIDRATIDPRAEDWFVEAIKKYCDRNGIKHVERSGLYGK